MALGRFDHACPICAQSLRCAHDAGFLAIQPASVYGVTKLAQEQLVLSVGKAGARDFGVGVPLSECLWAGQSLSNPYTGIFSTSRHAFVMAVR